MTNLITKLSAGAVALMLDKDPGLIPDDVKARLMRSARKIGGDATVTGAGVGATIIDCESSGRAFYLVDEPPGSTVEGFTIAGARKRLRESGDDEQGRGSPCDSRHQ